MIENNNNVIKMIEESCLLLEYPRNNNMLLIFPFTRMIKTILNSEKEYEDNLGLKIAQFFDYEIESEDSIYNKVEKSVLFYSFEMIDNFNLWRDFVDLFDKKWEAEEYEDNYKPIEEWIIKFKKYK